jgi:hypothetical protein
VSAPAFVMLTASAAFMVGFVFAGITERDLLAIPEAEYAVSDRLSLVVGSNLFAGERPYTTFGVFRSNSNIYTWGRFSF